MAESRLSSDNQAMKRTVLIVDDHPSFRASARRMLEADGYEVVGEAGDGESAPSRPCASCGPDLVLLDVQLPDLDGFDVAARLTNGRRRAGRRAHLQPRRLRLRPAGRRAAARAASFPRASCPARRWRRSCG